ncbi:MAG TPA: homocysteine S-methyltransferase family protein [Planctomicrobium sp.]|nr:homocysteine S-methyltransferase family protein [Planctomicrobium sp.]
MSSSFETRLADSKPILLDGATGTELLRRGVDLSHPSWTAGIIRDDPRILKEIHRDYINAGAEIITANTFRTHARNLESLGLADQARDLTCRAVDIVRDAANQQSRVFVAGSVAPLEDCYTPALTPEDSRLKDEHASMAENLKTAGVDLILIETQVTIREAVYAAQAAQSTGLPFLVSFVCNPDGNVFSGESLLDAYHAIAPFQPNGFLVNCLPAEEVLGALASVLALQSSIPSPIRSGAYANTGRLMPDGSWEATSGSISAVYAEFARQWKESGLQFLGGCCGTTPEFISAIKDII